MSVVMPAADPFDPEAAPSSPPPSEGSRLRDESLSNAERQWSVVLHLSPLSMLLLGPPGAIAPLVLWLIRRDNSPFNDDHGREILNFSISMVLWHLVLAVTVIGVALFPVLWVVSIVSVIRAAAASSRGEYFRYPMTVRML